jgi:hypothetical protein
MVREFQAVLDGLPGKPPAPLEEYRELICEMRRRGLTYREIAGVLADRFQVKADLGAVYDVLRGVARRKTALPSQRQVKTERATAAPQPSRIPLARPVPQLRQAAPLRQAPRPDARAVRTMPAAQPQVRKVVEKPVFEYDENEPLRLTGDSRSIE